MQEDTNSEKGDFDQSDKIESTRTHTLPSAGQYMNPPRSGKNIANPSSPKRHSPSSSAAHTKTAMRDNEPAGAFFGGFIGGVLIVVGFIAFFVTLIWFVVFITAWLFIPWFIVFCFFLVYLREGKRGMIDRWNKWS